MESETEDHGDYVCMGRNTHGTVYSMVMKVYVKGEFVFSLLFICFQTISLLI